MKLEDLTNKIFDRLVVITQAGKNKWNKILWWCLCDCGEYILVTGNHLKLNKVRSCGCLQRDTMRALCGDKHPRYKNGIKHNKELKKEYNNNYYQLNKDRVSEYNKKYAKQNPDKVKNISAIKRARKFNQTPILTEAEKLKVELYYKIAQYLGEDWQVDHIIPLSKDGLHHPDNLQITTKEYNFKKHNKLDFRQPEIMEVFKI